MTASNPFTLCLLRHAKSSWHQPALSDFERPLSPRGRETAPRMGRFMRSCGLVPDLILCSPAIRARETLHLVLAGMKCEAEIRYVDGLYDFGEGTGLVRIVSAEGGNQQKLLAVGHNPSMEGAAAALIGKSDARDRKRLLRKYPTAALAVIEFDLQTWKGLAAGTGRLARFVRPKDLGDA